MLGPYLEFVIILVSGGRPLQPVAPNRGSHIVTTTSVHKRHSFGAVMIALTLAAGLLLFPADAAQATGLFGSDEIRSSNMKSFDKWTELWRRHTLQRADEAATEAEPEPQTESKRRNCRGRNRIKCSRDSWERFISKQQAEGEPALALDLLQAVNRYMNRSTYIVDPVNWGIPDYWATPDEFFMKDGDCEDYAISKYVTLKRLGVDPSLMRLVVLQDENLRVAHAVLAVEVDGIFHILDNQVDTVLPHDKILHYRPVYSINEDGWWLHQVRRFGR